jgi:hypothetical protein
VLTEAAEAAGQLRGQRRPCAQAALSAYASSLQQLSGVFLATVPAGTPASAFLPYLGDYVHVMAIGRTFYGIFSANNTPNNSNFPSGVTYQRNANFTTQTLLNLDNITSVPVSIDPFFFSIAPSPRG